MAAPAGTPRAFTAFRSLVSSIHLEPESESNDDNPLEDGEVGDSSSPTKLPQSVYVDDSMDRDVRRKVRSNEKRAERKAEQRAEQEANGELPKPERNPRDPAMVEIDGLLLPDTIRLNDHDAEGNEIEEESVGSVEGVHFVDDDHVMGTRYYDDVEDDAFLATADQAALCRRCKKPGHKERDCPHIVVSGFCCSDDSVCLVELQTSTRRLPARSRLPALHAASWAILARTVLIRKQSARAGGAAGAGSTTTLRLPAR